MAWRFRQCPACREVLPAGDLIWGGGSSWSDGTAERACPLCGHIGETREFKVVHETHADRPPHVVHPPRPAITCRVCGAPMSSARVKDTCGGMIPCG